jgi:branched-chain amino acid transport system substrate-binding protein
MSQHDDTAGGSISRRGYLGACSAVVGGGLAGCSGLVGGDDEPIRLAVLEDRSGGFAELGTSKWQASRLAIEELNDSGGLLGREIEIVDPDPESDNARYKRLVRELLGSREIDAMWAGYAS